MRRRVVNRARLALEAHRTGVPLARPGSEEQQQTGVRACDDLVALARLDLKQCSAGAEHRRASVGRELDLALHHDKPGALVNHVILHALSRREHDHDVDHHEPDV